MLYICFFFFNFLNYSIGKRYSLITIFATCSVVHRCRSSLKFAEACFKLFCLRLAETSLKLAEALFFVPIALIYRHLGKRVTSPSGDLNGSGSSATTCVTTRPCGELWLVKGCLHMDPLSPLHQPQLTIWPKFSDLNRSLNRKRERFKSFEVELWWCHN